MDALKAREDVQMAAVVEESGGPDAVTFLSGTPRHQAVWWATVELRRQWRDT